MAEFQQPRRTPLGQLVCFAGQLRQHTPLPHFTSFYDLMQDLTFKPQVCHQPIELPVFLAKLTELP